MVRDLEKQSRLDQTVFEAQERTGDLLYETGVGAEDELSGGVGAGDGRSGRCHKGEPERGPPARHPARRT